MAIALGDGRDREGLGRALAEALAERGWTLVARRPGRPRRSARPNKRSETARHRAQPLVAIAGDVTDAEHRRALVAAAARRGGLDLVVNNASTLGATPLPRPGGLSPRGAGTGLRGQRRCPAGARAGGPAAAARVGAARGAEHHVGCLGRSLRGMGRVRLLQGSPRPPERASLAVEEPSVLVWAVDPGDMRTQMHQDAFPGEDISDRPAPVDVVARPRGRSSRATSRAGGTGCRAGIGRSRPGGGADVTTLVPTEGRALAGLPAFELPPELEAGSPPEARGITRDAVRMLVRPRGDGTLVHSHFSELPRFLDEGDLIVVNTSGTLAAAVPGVDPVGRSLEVHLSTQLPAGLWTVELRRGDEPWLRRRSPERWSTSSVAAGSSCSRRYAAHPRGRPPVGRARLGLPGPLHTYLAVHGHPIRYGYVRGSWPITTYQNVYATEPGSAEMPSAGRPFTPEVLTRLVARGVGVAPIVLHTGVASLEASEPPYPEYFRVTRATAHRVNDTRRAGRPGDRRRHHRRAGPRDGGRRRGARCTPGAGGPTPS